MRKNVLGYGLLCLTVAASFIVWFSIERAINVADSSTWAVPIMWASLWFVLMCLAIILVKEEKILYVVLLLSLLLSFWFSFDSSRIIVGVLAGGLFSMGVYRIKRDLNLNIKVNLGKFIATGKVLIIVSVALLISSQYYSEIKMSPAEKVLPDFNMGQSSKFLTSQILGSINPEFRDLDNTDLTVDQFILEMEKSAAGEEWGLGDDKDIENVINAQGGQSLTPKQKEALKKEALAQLDKSQKEVSQKSQQLILERGREEFSEIAGKKLTGSEKVSEVFSEAINKKISDYFQPAKGKNSTPILPMVLAIILFLTIVPIGNFISFFLVLIISFLFWILRKLGAVSIEKAMMEVERIA